MLRISQAEYDRIHPDFRGVWTTERTDIEGWENMRHLYMGKRTLMRDHALLIEGLSFEIFLEHTSQQR